MRARCWRSCREGLFPGVATVVPPTTSTGGRPIAATTGSMPEETNGGVRNTLAWPVAAVGG